MSLLDFVVIGAGMAGASVAWELAGSTRVLLLEREAQPGYHTTGRSAALFMETYGTPHIRALTRASRAFLQSPPPGFSDSAILSARGVVYVATPEQGALLEQTYQALHAHTPNLERLDHAALLARVPCLRAEAVGEGLSDPGAADIDVHALHQGYLRGQRQRGGMLRTHAEVVALRRSEGLWHITLGDGSLVQARTLVNAAGAWADVLGALAGAAPIGLTPCRRTAFTFPAPDGMDLAHPPTSAAVCASDRLAHACGRQHNPDRWLEVDVRDLSKTAESDPGSRRHCLYSGADELHGFPGRRTGCSAAPHRHC